MGKSIVGIMVVGVLLVACGSSVPAPTPSPTQGDVAPPATTVPSTELPTAAPSHTPAPTQAASPAPSATATEVPPAPSPTMSAPTPSPSPTPTSVPQTLGRIFPEGYDSLGVWSNRNTGNDIVAMNFDIHFDVGLPHNLVVGEDPVLSPASGRITKVYSAGRSEGQVVQIEPDPPLAGVEEMVSSAGLDPSDIQRVLFHVGHITAWRTEGWVEKGEPVGSPFDGWWEPNIIAHMLIVRLRDGRQYQFSPCSLPSTASFCGKCYPGTPYNCP